MLTCDLYIAVTLQPQEIVQEGTIAVNVTNSTEICEDPEKLNQVSNGFLF